MADLKQFTLTELEEHLSTTEGVVVVDCTATWCGPCKRMIPVLQELEDDTEFAPDIVQIDLDQNREWARNQNVQGVPAFLIYEDGLKVGQFSGAKGKDDFVAEVNKVLDDA